MFKTAIEIMIELGERAKAKRLQLNLSREGLQTRSGVSVSVIRHFEQSGKISLESSLKIAIALGESAGCEKLFDPNEFQQTISLDELLEQNKERKRGRLK